MFVFGEIQLTSFNGEVWTIELELQADSESTIPLLDNQATIIGIFFAICAIWFAASYFGDLKSKEKSVTNPIEEDIHYEFD